jgi:heat shock protein HspQ
MDEEKIKEQRKSYYQRNKEKMNQIARERYYKKRNDPDFYKLMLERNQQSYYKKTRKSHLTVEEEEDYLRRIQHDISSLREADKNKKRPEMNLSYEQIHELFFTV